MRQPTSGGTIVLVSVLLGGMVAAGLWPFLPAAHAQQAAPAVKFGDCEASWAENGSKGVPVWMHSRAKAHVQAEYAMFTLEDGTVIYASTYAVRMDPPKTEWPK